MSDIEKAALKEIAEEDFKAAVAVVKARLRRPWWIRLFPWRVKVTLYRR